MQSIIRPAIGVAYAESTYCLCGVNAIHKIIREFNYNVIIHTVFYLKL
jgi:hypothetical protein